MKKVVEEEGDVVDGGLADLVHVDVMLVFQAQLLFARPLDDDADRRRRRRRRRQDDRLGEPRRRRGGGVAGMLAVTSTAAMPGLEQEDYVEGYKQCCKLLP